MSKIGRKPILFAATTKVECKDNIVSINGSRGSVSHEIPEFLKVNLTDNSITLSTDGNSKQERMGWGLHRALLANKIKGIEVGFEKTIKIVGLGYKAQISGSKMTLTLGFSHKITYDLPNGIVVDSDRTGQNLVIKSSDKFLLGKVCDEIRAFRPPEPYKGTGIIVDSEYVRRKAGKAKSSGA